MADIYITIRNQDNHALTSIDGIAFAILIRQNGSAIAQEDVELIHADANFDSLPIGQYTVVVKHHQVEPPEATYETAISQEDEVILLIFFYLEPERVLLRIQADVEKRL